MAQNFNLVSPQDNGYRYEAHFGNEIVIQENSKCYLNFCQLSRESNVHVPTDQEITVSSFNALPNKLVSSTGTVQDAELTGTFTITSGFYTPQKFQEKIKEGIQSVLDQDGSGVGRGALMVSAPENYLGKEGLNVSLSELDDFTNINVSQNRSNFKQGTIDAVNKFNSTTTTSGGITFYKKAADIPVLTDASFDNYAILEEAVAGFTFKDNTKVNEDGHLNGGYSCYVPTGGKLDCGAWLGFLGKEAADLANQSGATPPATIGGSAPVLRTVTYPKEIIDPALIPPNGVIKTGLQPNCFEATGLSGALFFDAFPITINTTPAVSEAVAFPILVAPTPGHAGVKDFVGTSGQITGLPADSPVTLTQQSSTGAGQGFVLDTTSVGTQVSASEVADYSFSVIRFPGGRSTTGYAVGDQIVLEETATPGTGTITITVTKVTECGVVESVVYAEEAKSRFSGTVVLDQGEGFEGTDELDITQFTAPHQITSGTTPATCSLVGTTASTMVPQCYVGMLFNGDDSQMPEGRNTISVFIVEDDAGNTPKDWTSQDVALGGMRRLATFDYEFDTSAGFQEYGIQFYVDPREKDSASPRIYFRAVELSDTKTEFTVLYDSFTDNEYFSYAFLTGITVTTLDEMLLQMPFYPMLSVQTKRDLQGIGDYSQYDISRSAGTDSIDRPIQVQRLRLTFPPEMKQILGAPDVEIYPMGISVDRLTNFLVDRVVAPISNASYYVVIDELPLRNFKNKKALKSTGDGKLRKGYVKNILANIPLPFEAVASQVNKPDGTTFVTGLYQPPQKILVGLLNQRISTNQMSVRVFRMDDDTEADELITSVVNFTIVPPTEKIEDIEFSL